MENATRYICEVKNAIILSVLLSKDKCVYGVRAGAAFCYGVVFFSLCQLIYL